MQKMLRHNALTTNGNKDINPAKCTVCSIWGT